MTLRHAAALALVGWYLMYPPTPNRPLSQWEILNIFDSATECRKALEDQYSMAEYNRTVVSVNW